MKKIACTYVVIVVFVVINTVSLAEAWGGRDPRRHLFNNEYYEYGYGCGAAYGDCGCGCGGGLEISILPPFIKKQQCNYQWLPGHWEWDEYFGSSVWVEGRWDSKCN